MSYDLHDEAPMGFDWANIALCAAARHELAARTQDHERAYREQRTADRLYQRYLRFPSR